MPDLVHLIHLAELVDLVHLVNIAHLVDLVDLVNLADLVQLVNLVDLVDRLRCLVSFFISFAKTPGLPDLVHAKPLGTNKRVVDSANNRKHKKLFNCFNF